MSSDSEVSSIYQSSSDPEDEDIGVVYGQITPYQDDSLAEEDDEENGERNEEADLDGLTPAVREARYEREVSVESWYALFIVFLCTHTFFHHSFIICLR